ncbi:mediator of RNA polymerase II transcription subunit 4, partial [Clonorchis sinensis]
DILSVLTKRQSSLNLESLVELLLEKDQQLKLTLIEVEAQNELQKKIDVLRSDCVKSDKQINACQLQLKKAEVLLSTALYYSRQKLDTMVKAVKNPVDVDELVRFSHRISATHGVSAPDNWVQGDPRRPYPNREEIRRGYLGHLDDNGHFRPSLWDALSETAAAAATIASTTTPAVGLSGTPCAATGNTPSASTINPPAHSNIPMIPGTSITSHVLYLVKLGSLIRQLSAKRYVVLGNGLSTSKSSSAGQQNLQHNRKNPVGMNGTSAPTRHQQQKSSMWYESYSAARQLTRMVCIPALFKGAGS